MTARPVLAAVAFGLALVAQPGPVPAQEAGLSGDGVEVPVQHFPSCCPRPDWWESVGPAPHVQTMDGFLKVWQDTSLSAERKAKALFQVIEDHYRNDDDLTAAAVTYYESVDGSYPQLRALLEFGVGRYLDYDRPLAHYAGKPGDLSAGMVRKLARIYIADGEPERAVPLLRHILGPRRDEVNDHMLELAAVPLGQALGELGREPEAIAVLLEAKQEFHGDWERLLDDELDRLRARMGLGYYLYDRRISGPLLVALLGVILALGIFWRRRPRLR
jgi:hypothetical protein